MKKIVSLILVVLLCLCLTYRVEAVSLSSEELKLVNDMSVYLDIKPSGKALETCKKATKSENMVLRGLGGIILYRHYKGIYEQLCIKNISMNQKKNSFEQDKKVMVKIENLKRLIESFSSLIKQLEDERVQKLFMFYYFRNKNVVIIDKYKQELNLARFYRLAFLSSIFNSKNENTAERLVMLADK